MQLHISPAASTFIGKNARSLGLVLQVRNGLWTLTPHRDYGFTLDAHEDFQRVYEELHVIVAPTYLDYNAKKVQIGLLAGDQYLTVLSDYLAVAPTVVDRRWNSYPLNTHPGIW